MSALKALTSKDEYRVAFISPLSIERAAATALLDEQHTEPLDFSQHSVDENVYTWGRIHTHNVVITSLPAGMYGVVSATTTVMGLLASLPSIKIGLLVGIGAGIPESGLDIRLGDVAVGCPELALGGVVQYDTGKAKTGKKWERTGFLVPPPRLLLNALAKLQAEHEIADSQMSSFLDEAGQKNNKFAQAYKHPGVENNRLYKEDPDYLPDVEGSRPEREIRRSWRSSTVPNIHYGTIASGNKLVKDAETRREIIAAVGQPCVCLEMEAAGLMNNFPCLVIRGICDYADSHKNDIWQRYASATAAAFAKELLLYLPASEVTRARNAIQQIQSSIEEVISRLDRTELNASNDKISDFLRALYTCPYAERKDRNKPRIDGTCKWIAQHHLYTSWLHGVTPNLLWISASPGCGKSTLAKYLVDEALVAPDQLVCYFFFKEDYVDQRSSARAACTFLRQLLLADRQLLRSNILDKFSTDGHRLIESFQELWALFVATSQKSRFKKIICVLDALDECQSTDRQELIDSICNIFSPGTSNTKISILATSRPHIDIKDVMYWWRQRFPIIHLSGDNDEERRKISEEIKIVVNRRIDEFVAIRNLSVDDKDFLMDQFMAHTEQTYLWINLFLRSVETAPGFARGQVRRVFKYIPASVDAAYNQVLNRTPDHMKTKQILQIIAAAEEPFSLEEMKILLCLNGKQHDFDEFDSDLADEGDILETIENHCSIVVTIVDSNIYFHHQTARTFLTSENLDGSDPVINDQVDITNWRHSIKDGESNRQLAERCLWYLRLNSTNHRENRPLLWYCIQNWCTHYTKSGVTDQKLLDLVVKTCSANITNKIFWPPYHELSKFVYTPEAASLPIALLSALGLYTVLEYCLANFSKPSNYVELLSDALWHATVCRYPDICGLLLRYGALPDVRTLHMAAGLPDNRIMELLLDSGADVNAKDGRSRTALFVATQWASVPNVLSLLQRGINPKHEDVDGCTALGYVFGECMTFNHDGQNCLTVFKQLVKYEPGVSKLLCQIESHAVTRSSCWACPRHLLRHALEIRREDLSFYTVEAKQLSTSTAWNSASLLRSAITFGALDVSDELLQGSDIPVGSVSKALIHALNLPPRQYRTDAIKLLMEYKTKIEETDDEGITWLHIAMLSTDHFGPADSSAFLQLSVQSMIVNAQDSGGKTPLMYAVQSPMISDEVTAARAEMLLWHGADDGMIDNIGRSAHIYALTYLKMRTARIFENWSSSPDG